MPGRMGRQARATALSLNTIGARSPACAARHAPPPIAAMQAALPRWPYCPGQQASWFPVLCLWTLHAARASIGGERPTMERGLPQFGPTQRTWCSPAAVRHRCQSYRKLAGSGALEDAAWLGIARPAEEEECMGEAAICMFTAVFESDRVSAAAVPFEGPGVTIRTTDTRRAAQPDRRASLRPSATRANESQRLPNRRHDVCAIAVRVYQGRRRWHAPGAGSALRGGAF